MQVLFYLLGLIRDNYVMICLANFNLYVLFISGSMCSHQRPSSNWLWRGLEREMMVCWLLLLLGTEPKMGLNPLFGEG